MAPPSRQSSLKGGSNTAPARSSSASSSTILNHAAAPATPKSAGSMDALMFNSAAGMASTTGRTTPQSAGTPGHSGVVSRPSSAAAVNRRRSEQATNSPVDPHFSHSLFHANHHGTQTSYVPHSSTGLHDGEDSPSSAKWPDDEVDKGHGAERRSSLNFKTTSGRWTPTILSSMLRRAGEGRFSPVNTFHSSSASSAPGAHHASPTTPSQRQFTSTSPRMKTYTAEPDEIGPSTPNESGRNKTPTRSRSVLANDKRAREKQEEYEQQQASAALVRTSSQQTSSSDAKSAVHAAQFVNNGYYPPTSATGIGSPFQQRNSHPLSHAHKMSTSSVSTGSNSMQMHSPQMQTHSRHASLQKLGGLAHQSPVLAPTSNSSPLVVPQARRGAVNLRRACRRRKASAAAKKRAAIDAKPLHVKIVSFIRLLLWSLLHPLSATRAVYAYTVATLHSVDQAFRHPRTGQRMYRPPWLGAYVPLLIWLGVSLSSTFTVLIWHTQVFQALDRMSAYLQSLGLLGRLIFGTLIFITTFPPLPLYSTLIILCGFSFGLVQAFVISYIAALSGAIVVFLLSRSLLKGWMVGLLNQSGGLKKVVRAIEKRPKLLFLVRLAPYPYNLMNTLLASSPTLTLKTYTICTALALPKLLVHCGLGTTIKNFAAYNGAADSNTTAENAADQAKASETAELVKHIAGFVGVGLCVGIFLYLFSVARKAVDEELDDDELLAADEYELMLSEDEEEGGVNSMDELENDALSIANPLHGSRDGSSESNRYLDDPLSSQRTSTSYASQDARLMRTNGQASVRIKAGSEATVAEPRSNALLSIVNQQKSLGASDGTTPLFIAPAGKSTGGAEPDNVSGTSSYFGSWTGGAYGGAQYGKSSAGSHSRTSLADSIVEMEKHADLFESPSSGRNGSSSRSHSQRHDISIELSPSQSSRRSGNKTVGTPGRTTADRYSKYGGGGGAQAFYKSDRMNDYAVEDDNDDEGEHVDERKQLVEVDRNRASRRSQMGYEEERITGVGQQHPR